MPKTSNDGLKKQVNPPTIGVHLGGIQKGTFKAKVAAKKSARVHANRSHTAVNLSGDLSTQLAWHAKERCRHFFLFITTLRILEVYRSETKGSSGDLWARDGFIGKATHQIDEGFREDRTHSVFNRDDGQVIALPSTAFAATDAAHFCNLGLAPGLAGRLRLGDAIEQDLYNRAKTYAGNTCQLPQRVNIGSDRKIDVLHAEHAKKILSAVGPACSVPLIAKYVAAAKTRLYLYRRAQRRAGVVACVDAFLAAYEVPSFQESVFRSVQDEVEGLLQSISLRIGNAIPNTVIGTSQVG